MNICEELLKADVKKADELSEKKIKSNRLAKILGKDEVEITIREIPAERMSTFMGMSLKKNGEPDFSKSFDVNQMVCVDGIIDPNVKDESLMKHFGCSTPKKLVEKLFAFEVNTIAEALVELSGINEEAEEDVKNS